MGLSCLRWNRVDVIVEFHLMEGIERSACLKHGTFTASAGEPRWVRSVICLRYKLPVVVSDLGFCLHTSGDTNQSSGLNNIFLGLGSCSHLATCGCSQ